MNISKAMILAGLILSTIYAGKAQNPKQANIWYFGVKAGLDFTHGNPVALTNGSMEAYEGTATICDNNGNLLFYTNGGDQPYTGGIWNKNHQVMPNGYLENTAGCSSSLQSSVIVKKPGSDQIYYLFTTDCYENSFENGLSYSIIDMSLNGGTGDVIVKGEIIERHVTESLAAAAHANGKDYWIITHKVNSDSFFVYHFSGAGIIGVVKTKVGPVANEFVGEIRVSANGQRLAFAGHSFFALFDFDASTGVISNHRNLNAHCFAASFSPDCNFLYGVNLLAREIYQFDMLAADIKSSKQLIGSASGYIGSMQIGPDNKIYVAMRNSQYLGVITRPNVKGTNCNFIHNDIFLNGRASKYALPNYANNVVGECGSYPVENENKYEAQFTVRDISSRKITLEVKPVEGAEEYLISRRKNNTRHWDIITTGSNLVANEDLDENTEYEFRMDAIVYQSHIYEFIYDHDFDQVVKIKSEPRYNTFKVKTSDGFDFEVYPNPVREKANVNIFLKKNSKVEMVVTDLNGKIIHYQKVDGRSGHQQLEMPLDNVQSGIYQLSLKSGNNTGYKKIIVMN